MSEKHHRYKVWIRQAEYDLQAARLSLQNGFYEWACFQSEQSAEKAIKAVLAFTGMKPPKVHKLSILNRIARQSRPEMQEMTGHIESIQAYTFISRYPFILPGDNVSPHEFLNEGNANECINEASIILNLVNEKIFKHEDNSQR